MPFFKINLYQLKLFFLLTLAFAGTAFFVFDVKASNPTSYASFHQDLGRAGTPDKDGLFYFPTILDHDQIDKFRIFVPPGARIFSMKVYQYMDKEAIVRYQKPPDNPTFPNNLPRWSNKPGEDLLENLRSEDRHYFGPRGKLTILDTPSMIKISPNNAGWLYASLGGGKSGDFYERHYLIIVDVAEYNTWYDSINWARDVEGTETYVAPTPTPAPSATPTFLPGDLNQDRLVNIFDYNLFSSEFGKTNTGNMADLNKNGKVDIFDYNILRSNFGKSG